MKKLMKKCLSSEIPEMVDIKEFVKNGWISPSGDFYGCEGANHLKLATYIAVFILNVDQTVLKKGTFFNEQFDGYLTKNNWVCIQDTSWLTGDSRVKIRSGNKGLTQKQRDVIFDYEEQFGLKDLISND